LSNFGNGQMNFRCALTSFLVWGLFLASSDIALAQSCPWVGSQYREQSIARVHVLLANGARPPVGTAWLIDPRGIFVTASHVIAIAQGESIPGASPPPAEILAGTPQLQIVRASGATEFHNFRVIARGEGWLKSSVNDYALLRDMDWNDDLAAEILPLPISFGDRWYSTDNDRNQGAVMFSGYPNEEPTSRITESSLRVAPPREDSSTLFVKPDTYLTGGASGSPILRNDIRERGYYVVGLTSRLQSDLFKQVADQVAALGELIQLQNDALPPNAKAPALFKAVQPPEFEFVDLYDVVKQGMYFHSDDSIPLGDWESGIIKELKASRRVSAAQLRGNARTKPHSPLDIIDLVRRLVGYDTGPDGASLRFANEFISTTLISYLNQLQAACFSGPGFSDLALYWMSKHEDLRDTDHVVRDVPDPGISLLRDLNEGLNYNERLPRGVRVSSGRVGILITPTAEWDNLFRVFSLNTPSKLEAYATAAFGRASMDETEANLAVEGYARAYDMRRNDFKSDKTANEALMAEDAVNLAAAIQLRYSAFGIGRPEEARKALKTVDDFHAYPAALTRKACLVVARSERIFLDEVMRATLCALQLTPKDGDRSALVTQIANAAKNMNSNDPEVAPWLASVPSMDAESLLGTVPARFAPCRKVGVLRYTDAQKPSGGCPVPWE
jgi:hypothetical protein